MSGHSKWHNIRVRKGAQDKIRSKTFTIHAKLIALAAQRGSDPDKNPALAEAIYSAKKDNVPVDNIERAIKKWSGEGKDGSQILEIVYEGYAPGGVAVIAKALTDNRNRTAPNMRHIFSAYGGNLGETGSVSNFAFRHVGMIVLPVPSDIGAFEEVVIDSWADDYEISDENARVITDPKELARISDFLKEKGFPYDSRGFEYLPNTTIEMSEFDKALKVYKLLSDLEADDDVENVWHNATFSDSLIEEMDNAIEKSRFRT